MTTFTFDAAEFGQRIDRSAEWVTDQARAGKIPCRRIGRSYRFTEDDYEDFIDSTRKGGRAVASVSGFTSRSGRRAS